MDLKVFYSDHYEVTLPQDHIFPAEKYARLRYELLLQGVLQQDELFQAPLAEKRQILLAHTQSYYEAICSGKVEPKILRSLGLPWSEELLTRTHHAIGGVIAAGQAALESGVAGALSGGTHHAFADEGRGFCIFNDTGVALLDLFDKKAIQRGAVIDLDAHQGNGTAAMLAKRKDVFILDIHGRNNFPVRKVAASLDIPLPDGTNDTGYLAVLEHALPQVIDFNPDIIFYIGGVDPLAGDRFNRLSLTLPGLQARDTLVFEACRANHIPVVLCMGGGYSKPITLTVQAHVNTYRAVKNVFSFR